MPVRPSPRRLAPLLAALVLAVPAPSAAAESPVAESPASADAAAVAVDAAADVRVAQAELAALRAAVARGAAQLTVGARRLEQGRARLAVLHTRASAARRAADVAQAAADDARRRLGEVVGEQYQNPAPGSVELALSAQPSEVSETVRAVEQIDRVQGHQQLLLREATAKKVRAQELADRAGELQAEAAGFARELEAQVVVLRRTAQADQVRFTAAARRLELAEVARQAAVQARARALSADRARALSADRAQAAREQAAAAAAAQALVPLGTSPRALPSTGATCSDTSLAGYANGFLPASALCPLAGAPGHRLRRDAAAAYNRMAAAGAPCITDSYRDYAGQVSVFARKPGLAAVPGTSNHGLGVAIDFGCGAATFGSPAYNWLKANGPQYGWTHPAWAEPGGGRPEPWHWEFTG